MSDYLSKFETGVTGLATCGYTVYNGAGTVYAARATAAVTEQDGGVYTHPFDLATYAGMGVKWDTGGASPQYAWDDVPGDVAAIKAKTDTIGGLAVTVVSPVAQSGVIQVAAGADYAAADARAITFTVPVASVPSLSGATIELRTEDVTWTASSCTSDGTNWTIAFTPTAAQTSLLVASRQDYQVWAATSAPRELLLATGIMYVTAAIPEIP